MYEKLPSWIKTKLLIQADCWNWQGATSSGYGIIHIFRKALRVHRVAWELIYGTEPPEILHHICGNKLCCNPEHLQAMESHKEHRESHLNGYCAKGLHLLSETGVKWGKQRYCNECRKQRRRELRQENLEAHRAKEREKSRVWRSTHDMRAKQCIYDQRRKRCHRQ